MNNKIFIIAEIGNNHEGSYALAKKMIVDAWKTGVDAIKLQHIVPEKFFLNKEQIYTSKDLKNFVTNPKTSGRWKEFKFDIINLHKQNTKYMFKIL